MRKSTTVTNKGNSTIVVQIERYIFLPESRTHFFQLVACRYWRNTRLTVLTSDKTEIRLRWNGKCPKAGKQWITVKRQKFEFP
jgi:hypothetical protein